MLTPTDFIFNSQQIIPNFVEFITPVVEQRYSYSHNEKDIPDIVKYKANPYVDSVTLEKPYNTAGQFITSFIDSFENDLEFQLLFPGVRYLSEGLIVFERPPSYKVVSTTLEFRDNIHEDSTQAEYYLPIPWQVYIAMYNPKDMRLVSVKMFFTKTSLFNDQQIVYNPPLFNFYGSGSLCRPFFDSMEDIEKYPQTLSGVMASAYDWVWNSGFNYDITENLAEMLYTRKYTQFQPYLKSISSLKSFAFLEQNPLYGIGSSLHKSYANALLNCWQDIPLENISSITWTNFSYSEFLFQDAHNTELKIKLLNKYIEENGIEISDEEYNYYCYEECSCGCNDPDCGCCVGVEENEGISISDIADSSKFSNYVIEYSRNTEKPLNLAITKSVEFLNQNRLISNKITQTTLHNNLSNVFQNLFSA